MIKWRYRKEKKNWLSLDYRLSLDDYLDIVNWIHYNEKMFMKLLVLNRKNFMREFFDRMEEFMDRVEWGNE